MKKFYFLLLSFLALSLCANAAEQNGTISFGTNKVKIDAESVTAKDGLGNSWTITTVGTTSFTPNAAYYQIGAKSSPATSITFNATLPATVKKVTKVEAKFGGFSGTAGDILLKVGDTEVGTGILNEKKDVTVESTTAAEGNSITISITNIARGVKAYNITYTYDDGKGGSTVTVAEPEISASRADYGTAYFTNSTATATITCATTDATIKYAITDGTAEPTTWSPYSKGAQVEISSTKPATKTLWAKADKDGKSAVASKEFTFITEPKRIYFELVVDESQIVEGAKYVIADSKGAAIMGTTFDSSKGYYNAIESGFNLSGNMLSIYETEKFASIEFEPVPKPSGDKTWFVKYNNGDGTYTYLKGKGNDLASSASAEDAASISIEADNSAIISFASNNEDYYIRYNVSFPRFKTYKKTTGNFVYLYRVYEESEPTATDTGLDEVLVGDAGKKYKISCPLRVNYKDDNYVYASTTKGGFTKTAPTEAQKKEWWSDTADDFNQNDWVAIEGLDVEVGTEIAGGSTVVLCKNAAFPVVKFVSEVTTATVGAIDANTYRVANFVDSNNELVKKLWLVDPQPAEHCFVKGYVANLKDVVEDAGVGVAEIKSGEKDVVTMFVNYNTADLSITATGWYLFEGVVVNGSSSLELNAVKANAGIETGVEGVETSSVKVYGAEGVINVESEEVAPIAVYSANGAIVSSVEASSASIAVAPGFYIVKAGNSVSKVTVK